MSLTTVVSFEARIDIDDAVEWYDSQQTGTGEDFLSDVRSRLTQLGETPELYGRVNRQTRALPLERHKFIIYYRIESDRIVVTAVLHAAADPRKWKRRK